MYLLLKLFILMIGRSESNTIVHFIPDNGVLLNCTKYSLIKIINSSVQDIGNCDSNQCSLSRNDRDVIAECEGSSSCHLIRSQFTSPCLRKDLYFDMSFTCQLKVRKVGCYFDDDNRVLDTEQVLNKEDKEMSADICLDICAQSQSWDNIGYFGTQFGRECFCGNGDNLNDETYIKKPSSECNMSCASNNKEKCGGIWRMSVYKVIKSDFEYMQPCLNINQDHTINNCITNQLNEKRLCIKSNVSLSNQNNDDNCYDFGNRLYEFCKRDQSNKECVFNILNLLEEYSEWKPSRNISIEYFCADDNKELQSGRTSENDTGTVVGSVVGSVLFLCLVLIGICIGRRFVFCANSKEKLRNNPETNDYVGNQNIALPHAISSTRHVQYEDLQTTSGNSSIHNYSSTNIHLQNNVDNVKNVETNNSKTSNDKTNPPTYVVLHDDSFKSNPESNDDEYAVVDPTAESNFTKTLNTTIQGPDNYMILDPSQTGIDMSKFANTNQAYELAKPINDTNGYNDDNYALSPEGTYDHSGTTRHHKDQDTIYTHAVDNVYDSASRGVNIARKEDTYDHFIGQE